MDNSNLAKKSKVALITGAAHRIGAQITKTLHQQQYRVIIHYNHSKQTADELVNTLNQQRPNSASAVWADLSNHDSIVQLASQVKQLDLLVNNASSFYSKKLPDNTLDDWDKLINSNIKGAFFLSQALSKSLKQAKDKQGNIVNIVDIHAQRPLKNHAIYNIAKAGVAMMTKTLAKELAPNVRVNGVAPGSILWPEIPLDDKTKQQVLDSIPLGRQGSPNDIAQAVYFLANAAYITGQILAVDGGRTLNQ